jgi:prolyl-tRNA synthetase
MAPVQVVIVPIIMKKRADEILESAKSLEKELREAGLRVRIDDRPLRPGAKYYHWEMKGVPLRLELGPRDIDNNVVMSANRLGEKAGLSRENITEDVRRSLDAFAESLLKRAEETVKEKIRKADTLDEAGKAVEDGVAVVQWCGCESCANEIEKRLNVSILGSEIRSEYISDAEGECIICKKAGKPALVARSY